MNLFCVGLSHHTADLEIREKFAGNKEAECVLRDSGCAEAILLATCNRVEVYAAAPKYVSTEKIAGCLAGAIDDVVGSHASSFYRHEDTACAQHLFRVASGLDSMVVGETEVLGQAKRAYEAARASGAAGAYLHRLFQRAFRAAKKVRTHTGITRGAVSVGSVAVDLAAKIFGDLSSCKVLLLGAGETGERTARALVSRGAADLRVSNRSAERARQLAAAVGGVAIPFEQWLEQCEKIDILITSTSSEAPILARESLAPIVRERIDRPLFIIDIAVPRDVEPAVNEIGGVYLYDIDSLRSVAEQSLALRRQQIAAAEAIISEEVAGFQATLARGLDWQRRTEEHPPMAKSPLRPSES